MVNVAMPPSVSAPVERWPATSGRDSGTHLTAPSQRSALPWQQAKSDLDRVAARTSDWDGNGSLPPDAECIARAEQFLREIFESARRDYPPSVQWMPPTISSNEIGEVVLEWWYRNRDVTIFIRKNGTITFLKSWGLHIFEEMEEGVINNINDVKSLSEWLRGG